MKNAFVRELQALEKKEAKWLHASAKQHPIKQSLYQKVPAGLFTTLEMAFAKSFRLVFLKGTGVIEKTFDKQSAQLEFEASDYIVNRAHNRKSLRRLDQTSQKGNFLNHAATTVSGFGLGLLGLGLPDIPLVVSTLLKGIYEIALGYGFSYDSDTEKIYILRLIQAALAEGTDRPLYNAQLEQFTLPGNSVEQEILQTAKRLSDALLVEKFVQGIPLVGLVGGIVNHALYARIASLARLKYKKRYLQQKIRSQAPIHSHRSLKNDPPFSL